MRQKTRLWIMVSGKFRDKGKLYGPGQPDGVIVPRPSHWRPIVGDSSWKSYNPLDDVGDDVETPEFKKSLELVARPGGYYNVVNTETGEPLNDKALRYEQAVEFVEDKGFEILDDGTIVSKEGDEGDGNDEEDQDEEDQDEEKEDGEDEDEED